MPSFERYSYQRVYRHLTFSWQTDFFVMFSHRKAFHLLRNPSRTDTTAVLRALPDGQRKSMLREIAGAFQVANQKTKWLKGQL